MLKDPQRHIIAAGGEVLLARVDDEIVGCVALLVATHDRFELAKMAVAPQHQGQGIGRRLVAAAIQYAQARRARAIFLATNHRLTPALSLYRSFGFVDIPAGRPDIAAYPYTRANVFLERTLSSDGST